MLGPADSMFNNFLSVSAEPGPGSKYFNFTGSPGLSMWNTVIGHDNTCTAPPNILYCPVTTTGTF